MRLFAINEGALLPGAPSRMMRRTSPTHLERLPLRGLRHLVGHDSTTQIRTVSLVFKKEESAIGQAPQPGNICHARSSQAARTRGSVLQEALIAGKAPGCRKRGAMTRTAKKWSGKVKTVSTYPPEGLFTRDPETIARSLASKRVSPKGPGSGMRMLTFFINRAGKNLSASRRAALQKAKQLLSERVRATRERQKKKAA